MGKAPLNASVIVALSDHGHVDELLDALEGQTSPEPIEVLVVNRGFELSAEAQRALTRRRPLSVHALDVVGGRAAAWNLGLEHAQGELVIMLADDFIPAPELLEQHRRLHHEDPSDELVGIGPTVFPEHVRRGPFTRWAEDSGHLFGVSFTAVGAELPPQWFYCANTSAKRSFLLDAGGFDERFPDDAGDDYEFGLRLAARGMRSVYLPDALTFHDHQLTLGERRRVMREAGRSLALLDAKYPPSHRWHTGIGQRERPAITAIARAWLLHVVRRREADHAQYFEIVLEHARLTEYHRALG